MRLSLVYSGNQGRRDSARFLRSEFANVKLLLLEGGTKSRELAAIAAEHSIPIETYPQMRSGTRDQKIAEWRTVYTRLGSHCSDFVAFWDGKHQGIAMAMEFARKRSCPILDLRYFPKVDRQLELFG